MSSNSQSPRHAWLAILLTESRTIPLYDNCGFDDLLLHAVHTLKMAEAGHTIDVPAGKFCVVVADTCCHELFVLLAGRKGSFS